MSGEGDGGPARTAWMKHTVRVELVQNASSAHREKFGRKAVVNILRNLCKIPLTDVYCLQDFSKAGFLDVTLVSLGACWRVWNSVNRCREEGLLDDLEFKALFARQGVPLVLHMYNPYVPEADIRAFLSRYCSKVAGGEMLRDEYGLWTGRRKYTVTLKEDDDAEDGDCHPPGSFFIGPHRGFLWYPGQPYYCRRCGVLGHCKADCDGIRCRTCGKEGHAADKCKKPKECSLCGSRDHLYRTCPKRERTFASLFRNTLARASEVGEGTGEQRKDETPKRKAAEPQRGEEIATEQTGAGHMAHMEAAILEAGKKVVERGKAPEAESMETSGGEKVQTVVTKRGNKEEEGKERKKWKAAEREKPRRDPTGEDAKEGESWAEQVERKETEKEKKEGKKQDYG